MSKVKGLAFRSVLQAVASLKSDAVLAEVYRALEPKLSASLQVTLAASWYPIEDYVALWNAIQATTGRRPDFPRLVGKRSVEQDLKVVHKLAFAALSVPTVMGISSRLFHTYYDTGTCRSSMRGERTIRVEFEGCDGFSQNMWTELRGASECFAEKSSRRPANSQIVVGGGDRDATLVLDVTWGR
jgi:hypothetical protein